MAPPRDRRTRISEAEVDPRGSSAVCEMYPALEKAMRGCGVAGTRIVNCPRASLRTPGSMSRYGEPSLLTRTRASGTSLTVVTTPLTVSMAGVAGGCCATATAPVSARTRMARLKPDTAFIIIGESDEASRPAVGPRRS